MCEENLNRFQQTIPEEVTGSEITDVSGAGRCERKAPSRFSFLQRRAYSAGGRRSERGVALLLVIFIVTLATVLVTNLAYSTYLDSRISTAVQRNVQAEYLLKSALTLARILIAADDPEYDSPKDIWAYFFDGKEVPLAYFGITEPNVRLQLEIRPEESKLYLNHLRNVALPNAEKYYDIFLRFFQNEGFDNDKDQTDQSGLFSNRHFDSEGLTANLIDYLDADKESHEPGGIEDELPEGYFPNQNMLRTSELSSIPGFTPARIRQILPWVTVQGAGTLNVNFVAGVESVDPKVLLALHTEMTEEMANQIHSRALSDEPFTSTTDPELVENILPPAFISDVGSSIFDVKSRYFQIIAKVDYGTSSFFLRAYLNRDSAISKLPTVRSVELY